jgi:hypothetical protein
MVVAAMIVARSSKAAAVTVTSSLIVTAADPVGNAITDASLMALADSSGTTRMLTMLSPGVFKSDTSGLQVPIEIKGGNFYSFSFTVKGTANVNGVTDEILNGIYQAQGTNAAAQFGAASPLLITPLQLRLETALTNNFYQSAYLDFKIKPNFNLFTTKFNFSKPGFGTLLNQSTFVGYGTPSENVTTTLSNSTLAGNFFVDTGIIGHGRNGPIPRRPRRRSPAASITP